MLTRDEIEAAKRSGKLVPATPTATWSGSPRVFLLSEELQTAIARGRASNDSKDMERWARLEGDIGHFVSGGLVTWQLMKWLDPHKFEHWTLKSKRPKPSLRVFGRFAMPDVFVGTHVVARSVLKKKWDINWELEKLRCEQIWNECKLGAPFQAKRYEEYITENARRELEIK